MATGKRNRKVIYAVDADGEGELYNRMQDDVSNLISEANLYVGIEL